MAAATVLITGATGALGPAVVRAFLADGWDVRTLSRTPPPPTSVASTLPHVAADVTDRAALERAVAGVDVVVHLAALLHVVNPPASLSAEYRRVNVEGTTAVMAAARAADVRRVVVVSSICVYGEQTGVLDEDSIARPDTDYARAKFDAEQHALQARSDAGEPLAVVLRLAAVYGPGIKGNYQRLVRSLAKGRFIPVGRGSNRRTLIHEEDVGRAVLLAATHPSAAGRVFNVTDGEVHTVAEITAAISNALGRRPPRLAVPIALARPALAAVETICRVFTARPPLSRATLDKYLEDVAVSGTRIADALGFEPKWRLADGWRVTIAQMKQQGLI